MIAIKAKCYRGYYRKIVKLVKDYMWESYRE